MATFVTRVELHGGRETDYDRLHREMESNGFSRFITSADGVIYHLPTAEYSYSGVVAIESVRTLAAAAAMATGRSASVLVIEYRRCAWTGLAKKK